VPILLWLTTAAPAAADNLRLASWNLNNLHHVPGEALRRGAPARGAEDYAVLRLYAQRLNADIVALQEVNGPAAAALLFPETEYALYFSGRLQADREAERRSDRIYTGFAVRRDRFEQVQKRDYEVLGVSTEDGHGTRWGVDLRVVRNDAELRLLNVHLKSGCVRGSLKSSSRESCRVLARQLPPLEAWIDDREREQVPFVVLGDLNRALDIYDRRDHLWAEIDDDDPPGLDLRREPFNRPSRCWEDTRLHHENPIDFMIFNQLAWQLLRHRSFTQLLYERQHLDPDRATPSDHCPIVVELDF
jgi:endonuclease/exonuclease/phosphatase family metal-dependent hydrolase